MRTSANQATLRVAVMMAAMGAAAVMGGCGRSADPPSTAADLTETTMPAAETSSSPQHVASIDRGTQDGERPKDLPDDVPVPAGLTNVLLVGSNGTVMGFSGSIPHSDPDTAARQLLAELEKRGWVVERPDTGMEEVAGISARRGDERYSVSFTSMGTIVSVQVTYARS